MEFSHFWFNKYYLCESQMSFSFNKMNIILTKTEPCQPNELLIQPKIDEKQTKTLDEQLIQPDHFVKKAKTLDEKLIQLRRNARHTMVPDEQLIWLKTKKKKAKTPDELLIQGSEEAVKSRQTGESAGEEIPSSYDAEDLMKEIEEHGQKLERQSS